MPAAEYLGRTAWNNAKTCNRELSSPFSCTPCNTWNVCEHTSAGKCLHQDLAGSLCWSRFSNQATSNASVSSSGCKKDSVRCTSSYSLRLIVQLRMLHQAETSDTSETEILLHLLLLLRCLNATIVVRLQDVCVIIH